MRREVRFVGADGGDRVAGVITAPIVEEGSIVGALAVLRDVTDALWQATLAANKGPGRWYADADSLRYSFFDKTADD